MHVCIVNRYAAPCSCEKATFTLQSEAPWEWNSLAQFALGSQSKKEIKIISFLRCQILLIVISCIPRARCTFAPQKHPGKLTMCLLSVIKAEFLGSAVLYVVACESLKHCYVGARTCKNTHHILRGCDTPAIMSQAKGKQSCVEFWATPTGSHKIPTRRS